MELFKNFKLKVAEAEDLGLDKTKAFKDELDSYRAQLTSSYLSDKDGEEAAVRAVYDRYGEVLELSHILFRCRNVHYRKIRFRYIRKRSRPMSVFKRERILPLSAKN